MKTLSTLLAFAFASVFAGSVAFAETEGVASNAKPAKAPCGCVVQKDGKVCGVDSDCCCSGEKAKGRDKKEKAAEKETCCTDKVCVPAKGDKKGEKKSDKGCTACTVCM
jgi:hypothetical protein